MRPGFLSALAIAFACVSTLVSPAPSLCTDASASTMCFPSNFLFGTSTSAIQVEGGFNETGRQASKWDNRCKTGVFAACPNVADDFFHRYPSDVALMSQDGYKALRISISWVRAMTWDPVTQRMTKNAAGVAFYHSLIDSILAKGLEPVVTVFHWDTPTQLASYGDFANASIVDHFVEYADLVFNEFGSKVKYWGTINEPMSYTISFFYDQNPANEYQVAHNLLLSHAGAVERFRARRSQGSVRADARIGLVMSGYGVPLDASNQDDVDASDRLIKSYLGWWLGPLTTGDYPPLMRQRVGDRLPVFTPAQSALLKGSYDLLMPNFYFAHPVTNCDSPRSSIKCSELKKGWETDVGVDYFQHSNLPGVRVGTGSCAAFSGYAPHYLQFIEWIHAQDPSVDILLTENGWCGNDTIENTDQTWYIRTHLEQVHTAIFEKHIPIIGYMVWSFMDNWEWGSFESRFGLYHVAYPPGHGKPDDNAVDPSSLTRTPRHAARFLSGVAKSGCLTIEPEDEQFLP